MRGVFCFKIVENFKMVIVEEDIKRGVFRNIGFLVFVRVFVREVIFG